MYDFAYISKRKKKVNAQAAKHFFNMCARRVLYEWADITAYRRDVRRREGLVATKVFESFRLRSWNVWFHQWWDREIEHRADHHGLRYTLNHYFRRFIKGGRRMKQGEVGRGAKQQAHSINISIESHTRWFSV